MNKNVCDFLFNICGFLWVPFVDAILFPHLEGGGKNTAFCVCFCILKKTLDFKQKFWVEDKTPIVKQGRIYKMVE